MGMSMQLQLVSVTYKQNAFIMVEGKPTGDRFFIIRDGRVRVSREVEVVSELQGNVLGPGDSFGVISAMSSHSCIETVMALTDVALISVEKDQYGELIRQNTQVALKIIRQFSQRLRYLDDALSRRSHAKAESKSTSPLFEGGDYYVMTRRYNHALHAYQQYLRCYPAGEFADQVKERIRRIALKAQSLQPARQGIQEMERIYPADAMIFAEGEPGDELYIIKKGSVKISKIVNKSEVILAVLNPGDIFGEMALLENKPRMAAAVVYEECTLMAVNRVNFRDLISTQPQLIVRITALLAERLWLIYKQLANTLIENPLGRIYDALQIQLEKDRVPLNTNQAHACNFGIKELVSMAGLPEEESNDLLRRVVLSKRVMLVNDKIYVTDVSDVARQAEYYRRAQSLHIATRGDAG
jgi:CRP-like cAMP-binding protein